MKDCVRLTEGFTLKDVLNGGATFEVMASNMSDAELQPATGAFEGASHLPHFRTDMLDTDGDQDGTPFERHRKSMTNVTPDGSVMKKIIQHGAGDLVPSHAYVSFHYNAYAEYQDEPHDSSVLRRNPFRGKLDSGSLLPGLEIGVKSMRKHEKADILIQPNVAFGKLGSPPRIPPNSAILYEVELLNWTHEPSAEFIEGVESDRLLGESDWGRVERLVKNLIQEGNHHFSDKHHEKAVRNYRSASKLANNAKLKDEKEEQEQTKFLIKLYLNMAVCHFHLKNYNDVCINSRDALQHLPENASKMDEKTLFSFAKAHLYWGKALTFLSEYENAERHLKVALKAQPNCRDVHQALRTLDEKKKKAKEADGVFWRRALQVQEEVQPEPTQAQDETLKPSLWHKQLLSFKNDPDTKRMMLPAGMGADESDAVFAEAKALNLKVEHASGGVCISKTS